MLHNFLCGYFILAPEQLSLKTSKAKENHIVWFDRLQKANPMAWAELGKIRGGVQNCGCG